MLFLPKIVSLIFLLLTTTLLALSDVNIPEEIKQPKLNPAICTLSKSTIAEIHGYQEIVDNLKAALKMPDFENRTYNDLSDFLYTLGPRITGSAAVIRAADYFEQRMIKYNFSNVRKESLTTPGWTNGNESATMVQPRLKVLSIIGSNTVNTVPGGIEAPVLVIRSMNDFKVQSSMIRDKIVLFNLIFKYNAKNYDTEGYLATAHVFRKANIAAKLGAKAILFRSATDLSLYTPHFKLTDLRPSDPKVPIASITVEDADLVDRLSQAGEEVIINIKRENFVLSNSQKAYTVVGDYPGAEQPNESVIVSGHLDTVPVGLGAQDDAVALVLSVNSVRLLMKLNLRPRRTITTILWGSEELHHAAAQDFVKKHYESDLKQGKYVAALEADHGCFGVLGYLASRPTSFRCVLYEILSLFKSNYDIYNIQAYNSTDVSELYRYGVPIADLNGNGDGRYRWYYHSRADTINAVNPKQVDECLAVYTATAYILADMKNLPFRTINP